MKLNNGKINSVTYPEFFTIYLAICEIHIILKKRKENYGVFFQNFGLSGYAENEIYASTKMFNINNLCYQRINCELFFKLWSEKCKMLCCINHDILVTIVTKQTR